MILPLILIALTFAVVMFLLFPLRREHKTVPRLDYDIVVYRDQLTELDKDIERGLLAEEEAKAARIEIQRRMLAADIAETTVPNESSLCSKRILALFVMIFVPLGAGFLYLYLGSPELPAKPYAERAHDPEFILAGEAEQLAAQLDNSPDVKGYKELAAIYTALRFYDRAATAYQKVIEMQKADAETWSGLGEVISMMNGGQVTPDARAAFAQALRLDPHEARSRFYLGLAEMQINQPRRAVAIWRDLEADSAPDAPWLSMVKQHISEVAKAAGFDAASIPPAPPVLTPQDDTSAIMAMSPSDQNAMIHQMVERLAARMKDNPGDIDGWEKLAKAYRVLGEPQKAQEAESKAAALKAKAAGNKGSR